MTKIDYERIAMELWKLLDDIDTLDDAAKDNNEYFRNSAREFQKKRHEIMSGELWTASVNKYDRMPSLFGWAR